MIIEVVFKDTDLGDSSTSPPTPMDTLNDQLHTKKFSLLKKSRN